VTTAGGPTGRSLFGRLKGGVVRRSAWVLTDQMLSSVTNFALAVLVARNLSVEGFGAFGLAFALYRFILGVSTALWAVPVTITHSGAPMPERRVQVSRAAGAALVSGVVVAPMVAILGVAVGGVTGQAFLALAVCLPGLLLQDAWRQGFIAIGIPRSAAVNDFIWGLLQLVGVVGVVSIASDPSVVPLVLAWGLSGAFAGVIGCIQAASAPRIAAMKSLWTAHRQLGSRFVGEFIVNSGQAQLTLLFLAAYAGTAASAGFRGAQVVFGPQRVLTNGLTLGLLPEAVRIRNDRARLRRLVRMLTLLSVAIAAATTIVLVVLPDSIGSELLGQTWTDAQPLVIPIGLVAIFGGVAAGPSVGLRSVGNATACVRNQFVASVAALVTTIVGIILADSEGAAWGLALAGALGAVVWTVSWMSEVRRPSGTDPDASLAVELAAMEDHDEM
jgi:O-antigen/teichoic acid export membrane protein